MTRTMMRGSWKKIVNLRTYKTCLGGMVLFLLLTCTLYEFRTRAMNSITHQLTPTGTRQLNHQPRQVSNLRHQPLHVSDPRHQPLHVSDPRHQPFQVSDTRHQPLQVSDPRHQPLHVSDPRHQPLDVSDPRHQPLHVSDPRHQPLHVSDTRHQPFQVSDPRHHLLQVSDTRHQPLQVSDTMMSDPRHHPLQVSDTRHHPLQVSDTRHQPLQVSDTVMSDTRHQLLHVSDSRHQPLQVSGTETDLGGTVKVSAVTASVPLSVFVDRQVSLRRISSTNRTRSSDRHLPLRRAGLSHTGAQSTGSRPRKRAGPAVRSSHTARTRPATVATPSFSDSAHIDGRLLASRSSNGGVGGERCAPHHHVAFLKVHKAASSTVANILQRYGFTHHLNFVLPNKRPKTLAYNYISKRGDVVGPSSVLPPPHGGHFDILWNHAIYNRSVFEALMPADTVYVSILREPFQQFVSGYAFYNHIKVSTLSQFKVNPFSAFLHQGPHDNLLSYFRNKQSEDFGMSPQHVLNATLRHQYLKQLDQELHLVMIVEFFDESLVLLRRLMCWSLKDVLYISKNRNIHRPRYVFRPDDYLQHRLLSAADYDLYHFFRHKFLRTLAAQKEDFPQEVNHFKEVQFEVQNFCEEVSASGQKEFYVPTSPWSEAFVVTSQDCQLLVLPELRFLDQLLAARYAQQPEVSFVNPGVPTTGLDGNDTIAPRKENPHLVVQ